MATVSLAGSANGLIKYVNGSDEYYFEKSGVHFSKDNTHNIRVSISCEIIVLTFDDETQRDNAIATLLTYF